jgi:hypothetical protein
MCALELSIDLVSNFQNPPNASYASVIRKIHARASLFGKRIDANILLGAEAALLGQLSLLLLAELLVNLGALAGLVAVVPGLGHC